VSELPVGLPKVLVSTVSGMEPGSDVVLFPSVVDIAGLNSVLRPVLRNAAVAVCAMARDWQTREGREGAPALRRRVGATVFGVTTEGAVILRERLERGGCEFIPFHANGLGGRAFEDLISRGTFSGVVDWTTTEVTDELLGGVCTAGPTRLDAAAVSGTPQVVVPGAIDVINFRGTLPADRELRPHVWHSPTAVLARASESESARIGAWMAAKLNRAQGPVMVLVPELGFSSLSAAGEPFHAPDADAAWLSAMRAHLRPEVALTTVSANINDSVFATAAADALLAMLPSGEMATD
jgi:uncharacterized protein (UPF0261 family)